MGQKTVHLVLGLLWACAIVRAQQIPAQEVIEVHNAPPVHDYDRNEVKSPWAPGIHPYIETQYFSGGGGYGLGLESVAGIDYDMRRFDFSISAGYSFVRKVDDNDQVPNEHGRTRNIDGGALYHIHDYLVGGGASWGESAETPYRKYSWAPQITGGRGFFYHFVDFRILGSYSRALREYTDYPAVVLFTPGPGQPQLSTYCICSNGVNSYDVDAYFAMSESAHFLFHSNFNLLRFHETVTDPYNLQLTAQQKADHETAESFTVGIQVRY